MAQTAAPQLEPVFGSVARRTGNDRATCAARRISRCRASLDPARQDDHLSLCGKQRGGTTMNDARWLGNWVAQQVKAPPADAEMEALAKQAERAAARDGFSVDDALQEAGCDTFRAFVLKSLKEGTGRA
jgi:hypothetical protein